MRQCLQGARVSSAVRGTAGWLHVQLLLGAADCSTAACAKKTSRISSNVGRVSALRKLLHDG